VADADSNLQRQELPQSQASVKIPQISGRLQHSDVAVAFQGKSWETNNRSQPSKGMLMVAAPLSRLE